MKKVVTLGVITAFLLTLTACGNKLKITNGPKNNIVTSRTHTITGTAKDYEYVIVGRKRADEKQALVDDVISVHHGKWTAKSLKNSVGENHIYFWGSNKWTTREFTPAKKKDILTLTYSKSEQQKGSIEFANYGAEVSERTSASSSSAAISKSASSAAKSNSKSEASAKSSANAEATKQRVQSLKTALEQIPAESNGVISSVQVETDNNGSEISMVTVKTVDSLDGATKDQKQSAAKTAFNSIQDNVAKLNLTMPSIYIVTESGSPIARTNVWRTHMKIQ